MKNVCLKNILVPTMHFAIFGSPAPAVAASVVVIIIVVAVATAAVIMTFVLWKKKYVGKLKLSAARNSTIGKKYINKQ